MIKKILLFTMITLITGFSLAKEFQFNWANEAEIENSESWKKILNYKVKLLELGLSAISSKLDLNCKITSSNIDVPDPIPGTIWGFKIQHWSVDVKVNCKNSSVTYLDFREGSLPTSDCYQEPARVLVKYKKGQSQYWIAKADKIYNWKDKHDFKNPAYNPDAWSVLQIDQANPNKSDYGKGFGKYYYVCW